MKKIGYLICLFLFVFPLIGTPIVYASSTNAQTVLTFADLGMENELVLHGPFDAGSMRFALPPTWLLTGGTELELVISSYFIGEGDIAGGDYLGASLDVYFNDKLQQSISLQSGNDLVYRIPISPDDLPSPYSEGWHKISFVLNASADCDYEFHQTTVAISLNSRALLSYEEVPLPLDLQRLPWPIYQERSSVPDSAAVIISSSPTSGELQAAMTVMATFGRMTRGELSTSLITVDKLTEDIRRQSHLIFVGKPEGLPALSDVSLQIGVDGNRFVSDEMQVDDGILQLAVSPWDKNKAILVVGGNTDAGVIKASQTLSTGNILTGVSPSYTIIAEVNPTPLVGVIGLNTTLASTTDFLFSDLGYESSTVSEIGTNWFSYDFNVAPGQVATEPPSLSIVYSNSSLIDPDRSEVNVFYNDTLAGSIDLSNENFNLVTAEIKLPVGSLRTGLNNISIAANLIPRDNCSITSTSGLWMSIYSESSLHLPLTEALGTDNNIQDISNFPSPFINDPSLDATYFVLPQNDPTAWGVAGSIAYTLGDNSTGALINIGAGVDGQLPDNYQNHNLILIGLPSDMQVISQLVDFMPASFEENSNVAVIKNQQVIYRISAQKDLGYIELFLSPYDQDKYILGLFGTTANGLISAGNALMDSDIREILNGDLAIIDNSRPIIIDTRTGAGMGRVASEMESSGVTTEINTTPATSDSETPLGYESRQILTYGMIAIVVLMAVVAFIAFRMRKNTE